MRAVEYVIPGAIDVPCARCRSGRHSFGPGVTLYFPLAHARLAEAARRALARERAAFRGLHWSAGVREALEVTAPFRPARVRLERMAQLMAPPAGTTSSREVDIPRAEAIRMIRVRIA